jgi:hypothetical protein
MRAALYRATESSKQVLGRYRGGPVRCEAVKYSWSEQKHLTPRRKAAEAQRKQLIFGVFVPWCLCVKLFINRLRSRPDPPSSCPRSPS